MNSTSPTWTQTLKRAQFAAILALAAVAGLTVLIAGLLAQAPRVKIATFDVEGIELLDKDRVPLLTTSAEGLATVVILSAIVLGLCLAILDNPATRKKVWSLWILQLLLVTYIIGGNIRIHLAKTGEIYSTVLGEGGSALYAYCIPLILELGILGVTIGVVECSQWALKKYHKVRATELEDLKATYSILQEETKQRIAESEEAARTAEAGYLAELEALKTQYEAAQEDEQWLTNALRRYPTAEALIRRVFRRDPKASLTDVQISEQTGVGRQTVAKTLSRLKDEGEVYADTSFRPQQWKRPAEESPAGTTETVPPHLFTVPHEYAAILDLSPQERYSLDHLWDLAGKNSTSLGLESKEQLRTLLESVQ